MLNFTDTIPLALQAWLSKRAFRRGNGGLLLSGACCPRCGNSAFALITDAPDLCVVECLWCKAAQDYVDHEMLEIEPGWTFLLPDSLPKRFVQMLRARGWHTCHKPNKYIKV